MQFVAARNPEAELVISTLDLADGRIE